MPLIACKKAAAGIHYLSVVMLYWSLALLLFCLCTSKPPQSSTLLLPSLSLPFDCWPNQIAHYILYTYSHTPLHFHTPTYWASSTVPLCLHILILATAGFSQSPNTLDLWKLAWIEQSSQGTKRKVRISNFHSLQNVEKNREAFQTFSSFSS